MSVKAARRALLWKGGTPLQRHVLAVIGIEGDKDTDWVATLTLAELADVTGYHRATVARNLGQLRELGALEHEGSGGRYPSRYRVAGQEYQPPPPADRRRTVAPGATVNRRPTVAEPSPNSRTGDIALSYRDRDRDRDRGNHPPTPQASAEVVHAERLPAPAPHGARGELATGRYLDQLIAAVRDRRTPTLTRQQARDARTRARDAIDAGWHPDLVVAALVATSAFTPGAFTFAVDQIRRQMGGDRKSRLTKFEQSEDRP